MYYACYDWSIPVFGSEYANTEISRQMFFLPNSYCGYFIKEIPNWFSVFGCPDPNRLGMLLDFRILIWIILRATCKHGKPILWGQRKNCWPKWNLNSHLRDTGPSLYRLSYWAQRRNTVLSSPIDISSVKLFTPNRSSPKLVACRSPRWAQ